MRVEQAFQTCGKVLSFSADVPVNKTQPQFTKVVDRPLGEAIAIWEAIRPQQPPARDRRTAEMVDYLNFLSDAAHWWSLSQYASDSHALSKSECS